jgi:hypothetical protein
MGVALQIENRIGYHNNHQERGFLEMFASERAGVVGTKGRFKARAVVATASRHADQLLPGMTQEELAVFSVDVVLDVSIPARKDTGCQ